jgi:hypothetical protein
MVIHGLNGRFGSVALALALSGDLAIPSALAAKARRSLQQNAINICDGREVTIGKKKEKKHVC